MLAFTREKLFKTISLIIKYFKYGIIGDKIHLEASSLCQLKCPICLHGEGDMKAIGNGYLKFDDFRKFVDCHAQIKSIELSNKGEIFLNPDLLNIIKYAYDKKINLSAFDGVNFNTISEEILESLVLYKFRSLRIAIDGATDDTYKIYRRGGDFNNVINNIKRLNYYKNKYNSELPRLYWQFIMFGHNEHELELARKKAADLNMEFITVLNGFPEYSPTEQEKLSIQQNMNLTSDEYDNKTRPCLMEICQQLWLAPYINYDGNLLGCCANSYGTFGDVFKQGLKNSLKNEKYVYAKKMFMGKAEARRDIPCSTCFVFRRRQTYFNKYSGLRGKLTKYIPYWLMDKYIALKIIKKY